MKRRATIIWPTWFAPPCTCGGLTRAMVFLNDDASARPVTPPRTTQPPLTWESNLTIPDWLRGLPDGLYGHIEVLVESFKEGRELAAWRKLEADNALDEVKIKLWLQSD